MPAKRRLRELLPLRAKLQREATDLRGPMRAWSIKESLYEDQVEPSTELVSNLLEGSNLLEFMAGMQFQRDRVGRINATNHDVLPHLRRQRQ